MDMNFRCSEVVVLHIFWTVCDTKQKLVIGPILVSIYVVTVWHVSLGMETFQVTRGEIL